MGFNKRIKDICIRKRKDIGAKRNKNSIKNNNNITIINGIIKNGGSWLYKF